MWNKFFKISDIEKKIGVIFKNKELIALAFVHSSFWNEHREEIHSCNERLEFLGDSVLSLIIAEYLYARFPDLSEGYLSDFRSVIVEAHSCAQFARKLSLQDYLLLGKGEQMNSGKGRETIIADLFEALVGAIYLDSGFLIAKEFFFRHFQSDIDQILATPIRNWKAELQEYVQKRYVEPPVYEVVNEWGPAHQKIFRIAVIVNKQKIGEGEGCSKKDAQQKAACEALAKLIRNA